AALGRRPGRGPRPRPGRADRRLRPAQGRHGARLLEDAGLMQAAASERRTVRLRIEGRVQGVGFRYWTERAATELGLDGWVRNAGDGGVEAFISGPPADVASMIERCRRGPPSARVDFVKVIDETEVPAAGFAVLPTR